MKPLIKHQFLYSSLNLSLPYLILFSGMIEWHKEYTEFITIFAFASTIFYNGYTSLYTENNNKSVNEDIVLKIFFFLLSVLIVGLFYNFSNLSMQLILFLFITLYFENYRRLKIFCNSFQYLNLFVIILFGILFLGGLSNVFILLLTLFFFLILKEDFTNYKVNAFRYKRIKLYVILNRLSYIGSALLSFFVSGGYTLLAVKHFTGFELAEYRYYLLLLSPGSIAAQYLELSWFNEKKIVNYRKLILIFLVFSLTTKLILFGILSSLLENSIVELFFVFLVATIIDLNVILRLFIRRFNQYYALFIVLVLGSIPYFILKNSDALSVQNIFQNMIYSQIIMFLSLLLFYITLKLKKINA